MIPIETIRRAYLSNWWRLCSGKLVEICALCRDENGSITATVRYVVNEDGALSSSSFDIALKNITNYGTRVSR